MLATVDQFLEIEGMRHVNPDTARALLSAASDAWEEESERRWEYEEDLVEYVPGFGTELLHVSRVPLVAVSELLYRGEVVDPDNYRVDSDSGTIIRLGGYVWPWTADQTRDVTKDKVAGTERALFKVTYDGGYVTRAQSTMLTFRAGVALPMTLPAKVERNVLDCAVALYWRRGRDTSLGAKSTARGNVTYREDGLPSSFVRAAHRERRFL
jgi:hypothetical protein